jgi:membrane-associated phospholipid phosphatase
MNFMLRKITSFVLRCRLEDVMAVVFSATLLLFFLTTRLFRSFQLQGHDIIFILLPVGILGVKCLLEMLAASESQPGENLNTGKFLVSFFKPLAKIVRDWFPFLLLSACYYALYTNLMLRVNPHLADALLSRIDAMLLGGHQASLLLEPWIHPLTTDFLSLIYFSYVFTLPGVALYFYLKKEKAIFRRVMMGYLTLMLMGIVSYLLVPANGPEVFFADQYSRELNGHGIIRGVDYIMRVGRVSYDCFPSLHVGIPLLLSLYLRDYRRGLFLPALVYVVLMCGATIYLRYHYVVDVMVSFLYAPAAYWLNDFLLSHWPGERIIAVATAATTNPNSNTSGC